MTYTVMARCPRTGAFGIGIATYSLAVGSKVAAIATGQGSIATQAFVNPTFKALGLRHLGLGSPAHQVLDICRSADPDFAFRQVAVIDRWGGIACHTGSRTRAWAGHKTGDSFAVFGNVLKGEGVVGAMFDAMMPTASQPIDERLMCALEAGRNAGGQQGLDGPLPERSASLLVHENDEHALIDLRVDSHPDAVVELRRLYDEFRPYVPFYRQRWRDPANAQPQDAFVKTLTK